MQMFPQLVCYGIASRVPPPWN